MSKNDSIISLLPLQLQDLLGHISGERFPPYDDKEDLSYTVTRIVWYSPELNREIPGFKLAVTWGSGVRRVLCVAEESPVESYTHFSIANLIRMPMKSGKPQVREPVYLLMKLCKSQEEKQLSTNKPPQSIP